LLVYLAGVKATAIRSSWVLLHMFFFVLDVSTTLKTSQAPRFVRDSSKYWHKPNIARDEGHYLPMLLLYRSTCRFLVRT